MNFFGTLLVSLGDAPNDLWAKILNFFKGGVGTYILAVILLAVILRVIFAFVDIFNKKATMKSSNKMALMQNELNAVQKRYGNDTRIVQQKTSEIYRKYKFNPLGSIFPMLIALGLQIAVFFTLWTSLQTISNYNISSQYQNMKNIYANVVALNDNSVEKNQTLQTAITTAGENATLSANVDLDNKELNIVLTTPATDSTEEYVENFVFNLDETLSNQQIYEILEKYVIVPSTEETAETAENSEETSDTTKYVDTGFNAQFKALAEEVVSKYYADTQEGFLWIKNIYRPETATSPMFTKSEIKNYLSKYYTQEEKELESTENFEEKIFDNVVAGVNVEGVNGYYILTVLAVLTSVLSTWLSSRLMKKKNDTQKSPKFMYFVMPLIIGLFTLMYTSLFAIYLIVGQVVQLALLPLTTWIVKKWVEHDEKREKEKEVVVVDYRRKD